jgi:hypothetical protein
MDDQYYCRNCGKGWSGASRCSHCGADESTNQTGLKPKSTYRTGDCLKHGVWSKANYAAHGCPLCVKEDSIAVANGKPLRPRNWDGRAYLGYCEPCDMAWSHNLDYCPHCKLTDSCRRQAVTGKEAHVMRTGKIVRRAALDTGFSDLAIQRTKTGTCPQHNRWTSTSGGCPLCALTHEEIDQAQNMPLMEIYKRIPGNRLRLMWEGMRQAEDLYKRDHPSMRAFPFSRFRDARRELEVVIRGSGDLSIEMHERKMARLDTGIRKSAIAKFKQQQKLKQPTDQEELRKRASLEVFHGTYLHPQDMAQYKRLDPKLHKAICERVAAAGLQSYATGASRAEIAKHWYACELHKNEEFCNTLRSKWSAGWNELHDLKQAKTMSIFPRRSKAMAIDPKWIHEQLKAGKVSDSKFMDSLFIGDRAAYDAILDEHTRRHRIIQKFCRISTVSVTRDAAELVFQDVFDAGFERGITDQVRREFAQALLAAQDSESPDRLVRAIKKIGLHNKSNFMGYVKSAYPETYQQLKPETNNQNPDNNQDNNEDNIMTTANNEEKSNFGTAVADAAKLGAKMAIAAEATHVITEVSKAALVKAGVPALMLEESALVNKGVPLVSSILILWLSENYPDMVPKSAMVSEAAKLALSQATQETLKPLLSQAAPALMALATSGEKLAKLHEGDRKDEDDEEEIDVDFTITQEDVA